MNLIDVERAVAKVQEQLFNRANAQSIGMFKSQFRGSGIQFKEHQIYNPGDDVRFIDWKLSAKFPDKTFVKTFEEERNLEVISILDLSPTLALGANQKSKLQMALEVIFLVYLITQKTKDFQKVVIFLDKIIELPRLSGRKGISVLISYLKNLNFLDSDGFLKVPANQISLSSEKKEKYLKQLIAKKKEVLYFSDFYHRVSGFKKFIKHYNFHCFYLRSPIDDAKNNPFSFHASGGGSKFFVFKKNSEEKKKYKNKNLNILNADKDYLEEFIV